jgi:phage terminase large subunit-like protein
MLSLEPTPNENKNKSMSRGSLSRGEQAIRWIEKHCVIPDGRDVGKPVVLREWQRKEIRKIYDNPHVTRRAIVSFGRKNAKTTLAAFFLLLHLCGPEARQNSQLYSAAVSQEQAALVYNIAAKIVRMSPTLRDFVVPKDTWKHLTCPALGTVYKALSAESKTAYGLNPVFIVHDELGQNKGPRSPMYEALETATGAQDDPLSIIISTQAPTDADLLSILIDDGLAGNDPKVTVSLYTTPLDDDPFSRDAVAKANPALGDFLNEAEVMSMAADASRMPSREPEFRNLVLNQRVEANSPFVSRALWQGCGEPVKPLNGVPVYGGLDLSSTSDLTAWLKIGMVDGVWQVHPSFWLPGDGLADKAKADRVPYDTWLQQGFLRAAPGKSVDYEYVAGVIAAEFRQYDIRKIAFDRWGMQHLRPWLIKAGLTEAFIDERFESFGQGSMSMAPALRVFEANILNRKIAHGNHPVLAMCAANAVVEGKDESCRKLSKAKSAGRIDGMVALAMAFGVAPLEGQPRDFKMMFI